MKSLERDLSSVASALGASASDLISFASEDDFGGFHSEASKLRFPAGSLWGVEGQVLYAICRWLRPRHVVEVGTHRGASAVHILAALHQNDCGRLTTIDVNPDVADMVPDYLRPRLIKLTGRGQDLLPGLEPAEVIFEDASHETDDVEEILRAALLLRPRIVLSHDAEYPGLGQQVRAGWSRVFGDDFSTLLTEPSDCGLAFRVF